MIFHLTCKRLRQCRVDRFKYNPEIFLFLFYTNLFNIMGETALYNKYFTKYHKINIKPLKLSKAVIQNLFKWLISFSWAAHMRTWVSFICIFRGNYRVQEYYNKPSYVMSNVNCSAISACTSQLFKKYLRLRFYWQHNSFLLYYQILKVLYKLWYYWEVHLFL